MYCPESDKFFVVSPVESPTVENADVCSKSKKIGSIPGFVSNKKNHPIIIVRIANNKIENDLYNKLDEIVLLYISIFFSSYSCKERVND